jgi:hypothetical protein
MVPAFTESTVEQAALAWLEFLSWETKHRPQSVTAWSESMKAAGGGHRAHCGPT